MFRRALFGGLVALLFSSILPLAGASQATPEATPATPSDGIEYECDDIADYSARLQELFDSTGIEEIDEEDLPKLRPTQLADLADDFYFIAEAMDAMSDDDIPWVARDYHELLINQLSLYGNMLLSMSTSGILGALAYVEDINETSVDMQAAWDLAEKRCGSLWSEEFPGGVDGGLLPEEEEE
jgi:hypothetical protein